MNRCDLLRNGQPYAGGGNGGGNIISSNTISVRRWAAIGDSLAATVVADKLSERGFDVRWVTHPNIHCVIRRHPRILEVTENAHADVDLDGAYEKDPARRRRHFSDMFISKANEQLARLGINLGPVLNCRPRIRLTPAERSIARAKFMQHERPWIFVCPRSDTYACRQVPDGIWTEASKLIQGTKFWIGRHPAPPGFIDLRCQHLDNVIVWLSAADLLISVDTGPLHIAVALGVPALALLQSSSPDLHLSDQCDFLTIAPRLDCLNCQQNVCPLNATIPPCQSFDPGFIAQWANAKAAQHNNGLVSAVVAIWKPDVHTLNRCLEAVLPQVYEVVVCAEGNSVVPEGVLKNPKLRVVRTPKANIGYSGNANYGARQTVGQYLLMLNDDCFLAPGAVAKMLHEMRPGVGIVSNLLRYPDGTIYYAGKVRSPGVRGWGHIDHKRLHPTYSNVTEIENACGCCILIRRQAFYDANALDEELPLFGQDDVLSLAVRQLGYRILFTPHSEGVHMEHQSVNKVGNIIDMVGSANKTLDRKIGWYFDLNRNRVPGQFT